MAQSMCEIMWILQLLDKVGIKMSMLVKLWFDSHVALHIAFNIHIYIDCHFVHKKI